MSRLTPLITYGTGLLLGLLVFLMLPPDAYPYPDSSYLHARYAQNLIQGDGFVFNPDERILLTSAPLPIIAHASAALPGGAIKHPPRLMPLLLIGIAAAGLLRLLIRTSLPEWVGLLAVLIWLPLLWLGFASVEIWLAALAILALDLGGLQRWQWAGLVAGSTLLVSPFGLMVILLIGVLAIRDQAAGYWRLVGIPGAIWAGFALFYFGWDGLQGLILPGISGHGFLGVLSVAILLPFIAAFVMGYRQLSAAGWVLVIMGLLVSLIALMLDGESNAVLFGLSLVLLLAMSYQAARGWFRLLWGAMIGLTVVIIGAAVMNADPTRPTLPVLPGSKGYIGDYQTAFLLGGTVYDLHGDTDPHLYELVQNHDPAGVIIATAPDYLLLPALPPDPALTALGYQAIEPGLWQRGVPVSDWDAAQRLDYVFSPHLELQTVTLDRSAVAAGAVLRLRLDWELQRAPIEPISLTLNMLDIFQGNVGASSTIFPVEKWDSLSATTYHVLPIHADAAPGLYHIMLNVNYNAGLLGQQTIARVKIPAPRNLDFEQPPLAQFGAGRIALMAATFNLIDDQLQVDLVWRAEGRFEQDYQVFIHLTPLDTVMPVAQADQAPLQGRYPTSIWSTGEVIADQYRLSIATVPPGSYAVRVGWYHPEHGRLPLDGGGDTVIAGTITLE